MVAAMTSHFPSFSTFLISIFFSQVITSVYYAYNVFGFLQMSLRGEDFLTPKRKELLGYEVPQSGALASLLSTLMLTQLMFLIHSINQIDDGLTVVIISLVLWLVSSVLMFTRYITYSMPAKLYLIDTIHDALQLIALGIIVFYFH